MGWPTHVGKANSTLPEISASYLGRLYLLARTLRFMKGVWWYDYQDDGWEAEYNEHNFGIVRPDLTPKPSYYVMADVAELAARGKYLGRLETDDTLLWVLRFQLDGKHVWAAWSADDTPRQLLLQTETPDEALVIHKLGHRPVERGWGYRAWATKGGGAALIRNRAAVVVGDRPWLLCGGMESARLLQAADEPGTPGGTRVSREHATTAERITAGYYTSCKVADAPVPLPRTWRCNAVAVFGDEPFTHSTPHGTRGG